MAICRALVLCFVITLAPLIAVGAELKVLSWNVYMLPKPIKSSLQAQRNEIIPAVLKDSDYDVMFFQEAFTGSFRRSMIKNLSDKYPHIYYMKRTNMLNVFGSGVFVMSKHPFRILDKVRYTKCAGADCFADKGSFIVELELPKGKRVQFVPTHLQSNSKNLEIRSQQLKEIGQLFSKHKKRGIPQILVGDLNISASSEEFATSLESLGMTATALTGDTSTTNARINDCYKTPSDPRWIDHVWVDNEAFHTGSTLKVIPTEFVHSGKVCPLSDHHAMEAHLQFN